MKTVSTRPDSGATTGHEAELWAMADALRGSMDAAEYKHVVLGLIFLKYISDAFEERHAAVLAEWGEEAAEDRDEYIAENIFWVPPEARWWNLKAQARQSTIGSIVDQAMAAIERDNPALKDVLPKDYARPALDKQRLGQLIDMIGNIRVGDAEARSRDVLGRVYEYFLSQFASAEGKKGGEFYTPRCVVKLLVEMLKPYRGRVYDPCCGSSGMFVQSIEFIRAHTAGSGNSGEASNAISIYGQESNYTTWRLAKMNLAIRGIEGQIAHGDSFHNDSHPDLKADFILANPPFNVSDWGGERLVDDKRWRYGIPPKGNANFAWVQHIAHHLAPTGAAGFILANISLSSETGRDEEIRRGIVDADLVECIVTLPDRLFYSTPIPAGIWILNRSRSTRNGSPTSDRILFLDAARLGTPISRTHSELTEDSIGKIASTYHTWRYDPNNYSDEENFCKSISREHVISNGYNLLPSAYVNRGHICVSGGPRLRDVVLGEQRQGAVQSLERVTNLNHSFSEAVRTVDMQLDLLETEITFEAMCLGDLLERSDKRLEDAQEPEVLTCTERSGIILQRERFAKRVATADTSKYKVVRMGDIIYNPYLLWKGSIDQCWIVEIGITSPAYEVLRVRPHYDRSLVGQIVASPEMIRRYDGISFGTVQRRRRAPVARFLELQVNFPTGASLSSVSALLDAAQDSQYACRIAGRAVKEFVRQLSDRLH